MELTDLSRQSAAQAEREIVRGALIDWCASLVAVLAGAFILGCVI